VRSNLICSDFLVLSFHLPENTKQEPLERLDSKSKTSFSQSSRTYKKGVSKRWKEVKHKRKY